MADEHRVSSAAAIDRAPPASLSVQALLEPARFEHEVREIRLIETHISWVILTGVYAYKLKKPVNLGFLDFSTLEQRRYYCYEELRLNRRLAPEIYLDVVSITGTHDAPRLGGDGAAIEYAVKMREFRQDALLDGLVSRGELTVEHMDPLADRIACFHAAIERAPSGSDFGAPANVLAPVEENFRHLTGFGDTHSHQRVDRMREWSEHSYARIRDALACRKRDGYVRECHGDMHLGNIALVDNEIVIFDGIEFSESLRWIDVMSEVAFLTMDLEHRGHADFGRRFLNRYLEITGDYGGLAVLRYYQSYRAMVRFKVEYIRSGQAGVTRDEASRLDDDLLRYLALCESYTQPTYPTLMLTRGLSGCGKTTISQGLVERLGAVSIRSDVERKRLFSLAPTERSGSPMDQGIYDPQASRKTYGRLWALAETILRSGHSVIVDATFLSWEYRDAFRRLADIVRVPFTILDIRAEVDTLKTRVLRRERSGDDASEAGLDVLEQQLKRYEPLREPEIVNTIDIDGDGQIDLDVAVQRLAKKGVGSL